MDWNLVAVMVGIHALMFLTPGPDSIVVVSRATSQGMKHAFAAILGVISAGFFFVPAIAFGMDFINALSPAIWMAVRAAGALYLIYIGYKMLRTSIASRASGDQGADREPLRIKKPVFLGRSSRGWDHAWCRGLDAGRSREVRYFTAHILSIHQRTD